MESHALQDPRNFLLPPGSCPFNPHSSFAFPILGHNCPLSSGYGRTQGKSMAGRTGEVKGADELGIEREKKMSRELGHWGEGQRVGGRGRRPGASRVRIRIQLQGRGSGSDPGDRALEKKPRAVRATGAEGAKRIQRRPSQGGYLQAPNEQSLGTTAHSHTAATTPTPGDVEPMGQAGTHLAV